MRMDDKKEEFDRDKDLMTPSDFDSLEKKEKKNSIIKRIFKGQKNEKEKEKKKSEHTKTVLSNSQILNEFYGLNSKFDDLLINVEKLTGKLEIQQSSQGAFSSRLMELSSQTGELRSVIISKSKMFDDIELSFQKMQSVIDSIRPEKIMIQIEKNSSMMSKFEAALDKSDMKVSEISKTLATYTNQMSKIESFESLIAELKKNKIVFDKMNQTKINIERIATKIEFVFSELNDKLLSIDSFSTRLDEVESRTQSLLKTTDKNRIKLDSAANKLDLAELKQSVSDVKRAVFKKDMQRFSSFFKKFGRMGKEPGSQITPIGGMTEPEKHDTVEMAGVSGEIGDEKETEKPEDTISKVIDKPELPEPKDGLSEGTEEPIESVEPEEEPVDSLGHEEEPVEPEAPVEEIPVEENEDSNFIEAPNEELDILKTGATIPDFHELSKLISKKKVRKKSKKKIAKIKTNAKSKKKALNKKSPKKKITLQDDLEEISSKQVEAESLGDLNPIEKRDPLVLAPEIQAKPLASDETDQTGIQDDKVGSNQQVNADELPENDETAGIDVNESDQVSGPESQFPEENIDDGSPPEDENHLDPPPEKYIPMIEFIKTKLKDGFSVNDVTKAASGKGWPPNDLDMCLKYAKSQC